MKRRIILTGCLAIGIFIFSSSIVPAGELTLTTYYPSLFGAYDRLKLLARGSLPENPYCDELIDVGVMYNDNGLKERVAGIYVCQKLSENKFGWVLLSRDFKEQGPIEVHKVVCIKSDGNFGACLNNPSSDGTCACQ